MSETIPFRARLPREPASAGSAMQRALSLVDRVAETDVDVLIRGERGVGKRRIAQDVHRRSPRRTAPWLQVTCSALPGDSLEHELFGQHAGPPPGSGRLRAGRFEMAHLGTLLLADVGEMSESLQLKILHVLQHRTLLRAGSTSPIDVDVRVIATTTRDLEAMVRSGTFREDLYYHLQAVTITVPPLRERIDEIPALVDTCLASWTKRLRRPTIHPSDTLLAAMQAHSWPGNLHELDSLIKRLVVLQDEPDVLSALLPHGPTRRLPRAATPAVLPQAGLQAHARAAAMKAEREAIESALAMFRWNRRKTADHLGVSYKTLLTKMRTCGISDTPHS